MPTPLPTAERALRTKPDADEVAHLSRGLLSAVSPDGGPTELQRVLLAAVTQALTGHPLDPSAPPVDPEAFAAGLGRRDEAFRTRILQVMLLGALVLRPLPPEVAARVEAFARALAVDDGMLAVARRYAAGSLGLAAIDFDRNGYTADWAAADHRALHTSAELQGAWELAVADPDLVERWRALEDLPPGTLGRGVADFYRARGFGYPGGPGSAPPLLAQHDWVHVVADYGTKVESELEVFAFISRANDDPRAFSLLAMVVSLFETGYLRVGAGLFEASPGQLSREGVTARVADAMRRGALVHGSVDFLAVDWFALADRTVEEVREQFGIVEKSADAVAAGSVGPWSVGGISEFQVAAGRARAEAEGRPYEAFGATPA
ncbi:MAG TPA: hypothetical protein VHK88_03125 [Aquihabitans sp.]|nr:hypothetical protein [Aquihabitans sp.]